MRCTLTTSEKTYPLVANRPNSFDELFVQFDLETSESGENLYQITIHPKQNIQLISLELVLPVQLDETSRFLANGFQSWSETYWVQPDEPVPALKWFAKPYMKYYGDAWLSDIRSHRNFPHAWGYTCLQNRNNAQWIGSLSDRAGFTLFELDASRSEVLAKKDLKGMALSHSFPALEVFFCKKNTQKEAFDAYTKKAEWPAATPRMNGLAWTSWYHFYEKIDAPKLENALEEVADSALPFRWFQIDDGWQAHIGDWLQFSAGFPSGVAPLATKIKEKGMTAGLWLAPFCVSKNSNLAINRPDWLIKDAKNKPIRAGYNPGWGGWYYALDVYNAEVREHITGLFYTVFNKWGFGMVKLDFLFVACLHPPKGKTRGQVMHETMEWLRHLCAGKTLLACGVPLSSALGQVDVCRIGGDVHTKWKNGLMRFAGHRERVSTYASLRSTLNRWATSGAAFQNDPDVFILRKENQALTKKQQSILLQCNALLGGVLFTSDLPETHWKAEDRTLIEDALDLQKSTVTGVQEIRKDRYSIAYVDSEGKPRTLIVDLDA